MKTGVSLRLGVSIRSVLFLSSSYLLLSGCAQDDSGNLSPFFSNNIRGSSVQDYRDLVNNFDQANTFVDGLSSNENPLGAGGQTPAVKAILAQDPGASIDQSFVNLTHFFDFYKNGAGQIKMFITDLDLENLDSPNINTLVLDEDLSFADLQKISELNQRRSAYSYTGSPTRSCSLVKRNFQSSTVQSTQALPFADGSYGNGSSKSDFSVSRDVYCPIDIINFDQGNSSNSGNIEIRLATETLPGFDARSTIRSFGKYGSFGEYKDNLSNIMFFENVMKTQNSSGNIVYSVTTLYFVLFVSDLTPSINILRPYTYVGAHAGHEYYLIQTRSSYSEMADQASLLASVVGGTRAYGASIESQAEANAIHAFSGVSSSERIWLGLDDIASEGVWKWASGTAHNRAVDYHNWTPGEPNNDGNEDCAHLNFSSGRRWNDTECYHNYKMLIEVELGGSVGVIR